MSQAVPNELRPGLESGDPAGWLANPVGLRRIYEQGVAALNALPADAPSLRLLADETAEVLAGVSCALNGLALLVGDFARPVPRRVGIRLHVPDWLPPLFDAARVLVAVGAVELFWIVTAWPNGAFAITFAAIGTLLFGSRGDQAYPAAMSFTIGTFLTAALAAIIGFALLPMLTTFVGFSLAIGLVLVPAGAAMTQSWRTPMFTAIAAFFCFLLAPTNRNELRYCANSIMRQRRRSQDWVARRCRFACCRPCLRHRGPVGFSVSLYGISGVSRPAKFPGHRRAGRIASIAASPSCRTRRRRYSAHSS